MSMMQTDTTYDQVQHHYGSVARGANSSHSSTIAKAFGYSTDDLNSIPKEANLGLSCGNPLAIASLREGEVVIDLGSGAGFDVFQAAKKVGDSGRVIGVDMNKDMLALARKNHAKTPHTDNVSFIEANITSIPLYDGLADCIISNCVINLVPEKDKPLVFAEMARLLKSGGRVAVSDLLAKKELPPALRGSVALYVGCVAGASMQQDYMKWLHDNGFEDVVIVDTESDLNIYMEAAKSDGADDTNADPACCGAPAPDEAACCSPGSTGAKGATVQLGDIDVNEWVGSYKVFAVKQ
ncbi:ubiE/COQ5 methyltransferase [Lophiotrema nucula]|uniref:Arsenite methyltransferase n=1 Tax=Lophiotrema nucula TaxID=690887 RepID=A0A6A5YJ16_9PLEO|nr:ubiE/COQ5 methyltransferase [Lophiotrema nucula]